ncbi:MraY family glycosyltransferase [Tahibacter soli]|uniref:Glycosyltransferase family 4 protein n=1 Tax=Tahibacter soli TaxID=2983605 RepID=A0A9X4BGP8_9GAMM|nr:glycosyltransferase family 4 protein [Tahibacter soli]MDC8013095.1 glycosyltransferase family 4 protein [Tahibacter soli]
MDAWIVPLAFVVSAVATEAAIRYAQSRRLLDEPGRRRSHTQVTPRGGGVGIVVAALVALGFGLPAHPQQVPAMIGLALVAGIGWWDDHRPLRASLRLVVHALAALVFVAPVVASLAGYVGNATGCAWLALLAAIMLLSLVWSINLHNFIDGINGLLASHAAFAFAAIGGIDHLCFRGSLGALPFALAAACVAFLPFNFPRARVFMGDVGSGALGFLVAATIWLAVLSGEPRWWMVGSILASGVVVDATATLLSRMFAGRRWYSAHREHLYQWLVRSGRSHARVVGYYMAWNLLIAAPAAVVAARTPRFGLALGLTAAVYVAGFAVWVQGRRAVLAGVRARD